MEGSVEFCISIRLFALIYFFRIKTSLWDMRVIIKTRDMRVRAESPCWGAWLAANAYHEPCAVLPVINSC